MCFCKKNEQNKQLEKLNNAVNKINENTSKILENQNIKEMNNQDKYYIRIYNLTYIITTILVLLGSISGTIILYFYLGSINGISLFHKSISGMNVISFIVTFLAINSLVFFISTMPSYLIYKNKLKSKLYIYSMPSSTLLFFILTYYIFSIIGIEDFLLKNINIIICVIIFILLTLYLLITEKPSANSVIGKCSIYLELLLYFILSSGYTTFFILGYNKGEHDYFYIIYSILLPALVYINNFIVSEIIKNNHTIKSILQFIVFSFVTSTILLPLFIYSLANLLNQFGCTIETKYSDKIIQILGYQDTKDEIYYIEEKFIKKNLESRSLRIELENSTISEKYIAYCGRIYWDSGDIIIFKKKEEDRFIKIPSNKIFKYQGNPQRINCESAKQYHNLDYLEH